MLKNLLYNAVPTADALPALRTLWREAFGDDERFVDAFFSLMRPEDCVHTLSLRGRVVAALYALPCELRCGGRSLRVAYIYAVATAVEYRGRGIMRSLMGRVHEALRAEGYAAALLLPSSPSLAAYYGSMGYRVCASRREALLDASDARVADCSIERRDAIGGDAYEFVGRFFERRNAVVHSREALEVNRVSCSLAGGGFFVAKSGEAIVAAAFLSIVGGRPLLLDIFSDSREVQEALVGALCREFGVEALPLLVCDNSVAPPGSVSDNSSDGDEKRGTPFAMALPFDGDFPAVINCSLMLDK